MQKLMTGVSILFTFTAQVSMAEICDYTPSNLMGKGASVAAGVTSGAAAATGAGMKVAGLHSINHASSGAFLVLCAL